MPNTCLIRTVARYGFDIGSIALTRICPLFVTLMRFYAGRGLYFKDDEHVRFDVFYRDFLPLKKGMASISLGYLLSIAFYALYPRI